MGKVSIWKQWLIIAACILVSPAIMFALACGFGWLVCCRLWPRQVVAPGQVPDGGLGQGRGGSRRAEADRVAN